jgi:hypothetical protein
MRAQTALTPQASRARKIALAAPPQRGDADAQLVGSYVGGMAVGPLERLPDPEIASLADSLLARLPELTEQLLARILDQVDCYGSAGPVPVDDLRTSCRANLEFMCRQLAHPWPLDLSTPRRTGRRRAQQGTPLASIQTSYRIAFQLLWDSMVAEAERWGTVSSAALVRVASDMWALIDVYTMAMTSAYRFEMAEQMLRRDEERSAFVEALLGGRITETATLWEAADLLGLPYQGVFTVVAGEVPALARQALPDIENRLRARGIGSAWRLLPDVQIGVVSLRSEAAVEQLLALVRGILTERVGVSPVFTRLEEAPWALHLARVAMASAVPGRPLTLFDDEPLPALVVSAPTAAYRITRAVLGRLLELPRDERDLLLGTLATFFAAGGAINEVARRMYCHRNTVRHRLRRIEQKTGRSLNDPRAAAELCVALEALRRLPGGPDEHDVDGSAALKPADDPLDESTDEAARGYSGRRRALANQAIATRQAVGSLVSVATPYRR